MEGESEFNPYAPPRAATLIEVSSPDAIRRAHIGHETSVKASGGLCALCGGLMLLPVFMGLMEAVTSATRRNDFGSLMMALLIGAGLLVLGANLRRLRPWARIVMALVSGLFAAVTLLTIVFPLLNGYVLWLMLSAKGRMVFSPAYQQIIAFTPDVRPRMSAISWILLCLVLLLVIAILAALLIPVSRR
ncbi:hypothetical protein [Prosthecobacter sp.]|jgi:hypothetical protein|uniref:hypothetical protein n=1 Tax=Prosthecobacter sp. TaxID=1965333 RepID=UPI0037832C8A